MDQRQTTPASLLSLFDNVTMKRRAETSEREKSAFPRLPWAACLSSACLLLTPRDRLIFLQNHFLPFMPEALTFLEPFQTQVALVIRSHCGDFALLSVLMRSVEIFWPHWRWPVVLILDGENQRDRFCTSLFARPWLQIVLEPFPQTLATWLESEQTDKRKGYPEYLRAVFSHFLLDSWTNADFIAQIDSDSVLTGFASEETLFDDDGRSRISGATKGSKSFPGKI